MKKHQKKSFKKTGMNISENSSQAKNFANTPYAQGENNNIMKIFFISFLVIVLALVFGKIIFDATAKKPTDMLKPEQNTTLVEEKNSSENTEKPETTETSTGTESTPIKACTREYDPVCGSDGKSYANACVAETHGITEFTQGSCEDISSEDTEIKVCTQEYAPVCGSDGKTYPNSCAAKVSGITDFTDGICAGDVPKTEGEKTEVLPSKTIDDFDPAKHHIYFNNRLQYGFAMPNNMYYQAYQYEAGAIHTVAIGLEQSHVENFSEAPIKIFFYNKKPTTSPTPYFYEFPGEKIIYISTKTSENPKIQKAIDIIISSLTVK